MSSWSFLSFLDEIDFKLSRDFFDVVEVVERRETFETREADDFRDEIEIVSSLMLGFWVVFRK